MVKTGSAKKAISIAVVLSIVATLLIVFANATVGAVTNSVSMYSTEHYFSKYGITGTYVYVKTNDSAAEQKVTIHYNYMNGQEWRDTEAQYFTTLDDGSKLWKAYVVSYNTEYAIKYEVGGVTYWDNNNGNNYTTETLGTAPVTVNRNAIYYGKISATLQNYAYNKDVKVRYTTDNWATYNEIDMHYDSTNANGTENWVANIGENAYDYYKDFEYCVSYTVNGTTYWANNYGENYDVSYRVYP